MKDTEDFDSMKKIGIRISNKMETIKIKKIPTPKLELGNNNAVDQGKEAFFNLFSKPIYASKHSIKCAIIYFQSADVSAMIKTFTDTSRNLGVEFEITKLDAGDSRDRNALESIFGMISKANKK